MKRDRPLTGGFVITNSQKERISHMRLEGESYAAIAYALKLSRKTLTKGMTDVDAKSMQELLLQLGYALLKYGADADFGSETERAIVPFQKKQRLIVDGKCGEETHKAVLAVSRTARLGSRMLPPPLRSLHTTSSFFDSTLEN